MEIELAELAEVFQESGEKAAGAWNLARAETVAFHVNRHDTWRAQREQIGAHTPRALNKPKTFNESVDARLIRAYI